MRIAVAQLNYTIGDFEANKMKIIDSIVRAKGEGADLVVFAEQAISGAPAFDLLGKRDFLDLCEDVLVEIAAFCDGIAAIVGLPVQHVGGTASAAAFINNRKVVRYITKKNISLRQEQGFLVSGTGPEFVKVGDHKVAVVLGADGEMEEKYSGYPDTVVNISAYPYARAIVEKRYERIGKRAFKSGANYVFLNQVGGSTDVVYDGSSAVFNSRGEALCLLKSFEEDFRIVSLSDAEPVEVPYQDKTHNVYRAIKLGLGDFFGKNAYRGACLGLSGGIDSAVVAAIAVEVLGAENVRVMMLPSIYSSDHSVDDAVRMAESLGLKYDIIPINDTYRSVLDSMEPVFGADTEFGITEENIQARLRCVMLMALSNKYGLKLLNTSNKSELAVGYGTLYGDNTGVMSIIGDLYKGEVFDLARHINRGGEVIPQNILDKEPSGELRPLMKDTDELPPYDVTDAIIYRMIELRQSREEIIDAGFDAPVVRKIYGMILRNEQKRYQFCPTLKLSTCAFNSERMMPITSKYGF